MLNIEACLEVLLKGDGEVKNLIDGVEKAKKTLNQGGKEAKKFGKEVNQLQERFKQIRKVGLAFSAISTAIGVGALSALKAASDYEKLQISIEGLTGSTAQAVKFVKELDEFSNATPFESTEIQKQGRTLLAFGLAQDEVIGKLKQLGDVSAGTDTALEENVRTYGKVLATGKLTGEVLNQFAERGVPLQQALADVLGVQSSEINKLASESKISLGDVNDAFQSLTTGSGVFAEQLARQSATVAGRFSTLLGVVNSFKIDFGKAINSAFNIAGIITAVTKVVVGFRNAFENLGETGRKTSLILVGLFAAIGPIVLAIGTLGPILAPVISGFGIIASFVGPILAVGAAIVGIASAAKSAALESGIFKDLLELFSPVIEIFKTSLSNITDSLFSFKDVAKFAFNAVGVLAQGLFKVVKIPFRLIFKAVSLITTNFARFGSIAGKAMRIVLIGFEKLTDVDVSNAIASIEGANARLDDFIKKRAEADKGPVSGLLTETIDDFGSINTNSADAAYEKITSFFKKKPKELSDEVEKSTQAVIDAPAEVVDSELSAADKKIQEAFDRVQLGFESFGQNLSGVTSEFASSTISEINAALKDATDLGTIEALELARDKYNMALDALDPVEASRLDELTDRIDTGFQNFGDDLGGVTEEFAKKTISQIRSALADVTDPEVIAALEQSLDKYEKSIEKFEKQETKIEGLIPDPEQLGINALVSVFDQVIDGSKNMADAITDTVNQILKDLTRQAFIQAVSSLAGLIGGAGATTTTGATGSVPGFAQGGLLKGPGTETSDSILLRGSKNEFMMDAKTVRHFGASHLYGMQAEARGKKNSIQARLDGLASRSRVGKTRFMEGGLIGDQGLSSKSQNIKVELISNTKEPIEIEQVGKRQSGEDLVVGIVVKNIARNGQIRQAMLGTRGRR